jgi:hypothetical protein
VSKGWAISYWSEFDLELAAPSSGWDIGELDDRIDIDVFASGLGRVLVDGGNARLTKQTVSLLAAPRRTIFRDGVRQCAVDDPDERRDDGGTALTLRLKNGARHQGRQQQER